MHGGGSWPLYAQQVGFFFQMDITCHRNENKQDSSVDNAWMPLKHVAFPGPCRPNAASKWQVPGVCVLLAGLECRVTGYQIAIVGDMVGEQRAQSLDIVAPIPMQFAGHTEPGHQLCTGG